MSENGKTFQAPESLNILFTCVGRRVVLLQAFRRALTELGVPGTLVATDITTAAAAMHVADVAELVPPARSEEYLPRLLDLVRRHAIGLLVPLTDLDLQLLADNRDAFAALGCTVMISTPEVVAVCRNKRRFHALMEQVGLGGIRTESLESFLAAPFYPCFAKPARGSAGIGSARLDNEAQLRVHVATFGPDLLLQEFIPGQEYTIDVYRRRDGQVVTAVPRQRLGIRSGEVEKALTVRDAELIAAAERLAGHLEGLWGVFNAQCRRPPGEPPRFIEVNPRFGGGVPLSLAAGVDLPAMLLREVLGLPVEPCVGQFTDHLLMLRYDEALFTHVRDPAALPGYQQPTVK